MQARSIGLVLPINKVFVIKRWSTAELCSFEIHVQYGGISATQGYDEILPCRIQATSVANGLKIRVLYDS